MAKDARNQSADFVRLNAGGATPETAQSSNSKDAAFENLFRQFHRAAAMPVVVQQAPEEAGLPPRVEN
jgi:hypothetical protein